MDLGKMWSFLLQSVYGLTRVFRLHTLNKLNLPNKIVKIDVITIILDMNTMCSKGESVFFIWLVDYTYHKVHLHV